MIVVEDLVKRHGSVEVLRGLSLTIGKGEAAAIIGPSGGGKSTFLRCINGLETFQSGKVSIGNLSLAPMMHEQRDAALLRQVRRRAGMVFQQFNLFPHLSVLDNLCEAPIQVLRQPRDEVVARAKGLLERMGVLDQRDKRPGALSGGQQQRVAIARALMMQPEVMLFDEPTSALDPVMAGEVLAVMTDLAKEGQTMAVVTHSMSFARSVATHVHVFAGGHDVEHGPPDRLFEDPQHEITKAFLLDAERR